MMFKIVNIAIFASGGGSNAEAIIRKFKNSDRAKIGLIVTNNSNAGIIKKAENHNIPIFIHSQEQETGSSLLEILKENQIDFIVLAGYLRKISPQLVDAYEGRIINIPCFVT